ncbi:MAG: hypothetical protein H0U76_00355 [Ktedonobacteraceae bacterium]|nr:hypothetical protein [Ktedonobacteraceae bacterium]
MSWIPYARFQSALRLSPAELSRQLESVQSGYDITYHGLQVVLRPGRFQGRSIPIIAKGLIQPDGIEVQVMCNPAHVTFIGVVFLSGVLLLITQGSFSNIPILAVMGGLTYLSTLISFDSALQDIKQIFARIEQVPHDPPAPSRSRRRHSARTNTRK